MRGDTVMAVKLMKVFLALLSLHNLQPPWVNSQEPWGSLLSINTPGILLNKVT